MKYIRTKDGIYELIWDVIEKDSKQFIIEKYDGAIYEEEIIDQSDTIEELCDEFVIIDEDNEPNIKQGRDIDHCRRIWAINNCLIYGAIWTEKGLIYVAKMNDKGELELL